MNEIESTISAVLCELLKIQKNLDVNDLEWTVFLEWYDIFKFHNCFNLYYMFTEFLFGHANLGQYSCFLNAFSPKPICSEKKKKNFNPLDCHPYRLRESLYAPGRKFWRAIFFFFFFLMKIVKSSFIENIT